MSCADNTNHSIKAPKRPQIYYLYTCPTQPDRTIITETNITRPQTHTISEKCIIEILISSSKQSFIFICHISGPPMSQGGNRHRIHDTVSDTLGWFRGRGVICYPFVRHLAKKLVANKSMEH